MLLLRDLELCYLFNEQYKNEYKNRNLTGKKIDKLVFIAALFAN